MSSLPKAFVTPEEYLEIDRKSEERHEYHNGEIFEIFAASRSHSLICTHIVLELGLQLEERPCELYSKDLRLRITSTGLYTYPDVMVVCGEAKFADDQKDTLLNPALIIEVLSPSSGDYDRGKKFDDYRTLPSLVEYVTVAQNAAQIVHYTRLPEEWRLKYFEDLGQTVQLASIDCVLPLSRVYRKINFAAG
jgi:Uma2 family endonuclease